MSKSHKKTWQEKMWVVISICAIIAMVFFTFLPLFSAAQ